MLDQIDTLRYLLFACIGNLVDLFIMIHRNDDIALFVPLFKLKDVNMYCYHIHRYRSVVYDSVFFSEPRS